MKAVLYARVSTTDQNVKQQVEYLEKWAKGNGYDIVRVVSDEESGTKDLVDRKKFNRLLNNPKADAIIVYKLDRLTRNWNDVTYIERYFSENWNTCRLISAGDPVDLSCAVGKFNFRVLMALNCYMPEELVERQKIGIARAKKEGKYKGRKLGAKDKKKRK